jgi:molybdate transport system substrate-binding protein
MTAALEFLVRSHRARCGIGPVIGVLISLAGCAGSSRNGEQGEPLRVAAASDLRHVLPRLAERFEAKTGVKVTPTFGASGQLAEQIKQGAPFDVFLAANQSFVVDLVARKLIEPGSAQPYARGSLVVAVYREFADKIRSLEDLAKPEVKRIALANPETAPYGKAGKQALARAGLLDRLGGKIVLAESVAQALSYAQQGDAEAALIGRSIARVPEIRIVEIDAKLYDPIVQSLGILTSSHRKAQAEAFTEFILGEEGRTMLSEFGLAPADIATRHLNDPKVKADPRGLDSHE